MANNTQQDRQRKAAVRMAIVLALVALACYVTFIVTRL